MNKRWLVVVGGIAVAGVLGAGVVMAQTPPAGTASGTTFLDRVAQKLGIDTPKLQDAVTSARNDQIDEAVKNGDLTQQQADQLKQRAANEPDDGFGKAFGLGRGKGGPEFKFGLGLGAERDKLAAFLGISASELQTQLQAPNATLASVAQANGKSREELKTFISGEAKARLDQEVASGKLTQQAADQMLTKLNGNLDAMIDGTMGWGMKSRGHGPGNNESEQDDATPGTTPAPQSGSLNGTFSS